MKTKDEIIREIQNIEATYGYIVDQPFASIQINAPVALMQISTIAKLDILYWAIGQDRPKYKYDER